VVAPYYWTLALDHGGHGDSDWDPERRYDLDSLVRDVDTILRAFEIERAVEIGPDIHSRGSMRIRQDVESSIEPTFGSVAEYARVLSLAYPAATTAAIDRMA
jgi:hypothetical protein